MREGVDYYATACQKLEREREEESTMVKDRFWRCFKAFGIVFISVFFKKNKNYF